MRELKVSLAIAKNIKTSKDLGDFYAFIESCGDEYEYSFPESESKRIDKLVENICYTQGVYDLKNVERIMCAK